VSPAATPARWEARKAAGTAASLPRGRQRATGHRRAGRGQPDRSLPCPGVDDPHDVDDAVAVDEEHVDLPVSLPRRRQRLAGLPGARGAKLSASGPLYVPVPTTQETRKAPAESRTPDMVWSFR